MTRRRISPAERLASAEKDLLLADIARRSEWDQFLVEQAVYAYGQDNETFSANDMRNVLPDLGHGFLGAAINALRSSGVIEHTRQYVPSTSAATHGHPIAVWRLSDKGRAIAGQRAAARQQRRAA